MESENGGKVFFSKLLNVEDSKDISSAVNYIYGGKYSDNKLATLDDLLSWRPSFLSSILTKKDNILKNDALIDYTSKCGVTKDTIAHPEFYLAWIVEDKEYGCVLNNWTENCKVEEIELDKFNLNEKNLNDSLDDVNEVNLQKVELGLDDNFIKICKIIDRLIVNKSLQRQRDGINNDGYKGLLNCVFGNESYKIFFKAIAKIERIGEYFDNIDKISCEDKEFQNLQQKLGQAKVKLTVKDGSIVAEDYDYEKQKNEINDIDNDIKEDKNKINETNNNIKEDKKEGKNGLLWFLGIFGVGGIGLGVASAINCYVTTFWAFLAFKGTAAVLSVAIPGGVGALFLVILIFSLIYKRSATQNNDSIIRNISDVLSMESKDQDKDKNKDKEDKDEEEVPMQDNGVEKNDTKNNENNK